MATQIRLSIPRIIQKTWFSCGPSCLQMMVACDGLRLSHLRAISLLQAYPNGTDMEVFCRVYWEVTGRKLRQVTIAGVKKALNRGVPVLAVDSVSNHQDHVVVVVGWDGDDFIVQDPALLSRSKGLHRSRRSRQELLESSGNEFYAPGSRQGVPKRTIPRFRIPL